MTRPMREKTVPLECARLTAELRALRERSALTLAALAQESAYSRSSWQRFLNGTALPPWPAVRALCRLAGESEPRIRALWELAESAWSRRDAIAPAPAAGAQDDPTPNVTTQDDPTPDVTAQVVEVPADAPPADAPPAVAPPATAPPAVPRFFRRARRPWSLAVAAFAAGLALCLAVMAAVTHPWAGAADTTAGLSSTAGYRVGCTGTACNGLDAGLTLCGKQAQTVLHLQTRSGAWLEVRYNSRCRAAWARFWNTRVGDELTLTVPGQPPQKVIVKDPGSVDSFLYTPMAALTDHRSRLTACMTTAVWPTALCYSAPAP
jgi:transcriptional regulator with XRE-family HTH domain